MTLRINNKIKQSVAGNWGKPDNFSQKHTKIVDKLFDEEPKKYPSKKKKKPKVKKVWTSYHSCPFCFKEQVLIKEKTKERYVLHRYEPVCSCGAKEVPECPACKRRTWFKDLVYKHQICGCGFEGAKKYAK